MEIVEKVQNRSGTPLELIKLQEIVDKGEQDRISELQDCLILEILSRLPTTEDAIRTGTLSKRWKHVWTSVPTLIFKHNPAKHPWSDFVSFIDKTLAQCRHLKLKEFYLCTHNYDNEFQSQINEWIRYAIRCNVEKLGIKLVLYIKLWNMKRHGYQLDEHFFTSSSFTLLKLASCTFTPNVAISWKNLRTLFITSMKLDEDLIKNIVSGSPQLETLVLDFCHGFRLLNITSKSVKNLVLGGHSNHHYAYENDCIITINAPNILSVTIRYYFCFISKILLLNVSSVVEATLNFRMLGHYMWEEMEEEMVKGFISNLPHVKEFKIGVHCVGVLSRLKAKGFVFPHINIHYGGPDGDSLKSGDGERALAW